MFSFDGFQNVHSRKILNRGCTIRLDSEQEVGQRPIAIVGNEQRGGFGDNVKVLRLKEQ